LFIRWIKIIKLLFNYRKYDYKVIEKEVGELHGMPQKVGQHLNFYLNSDQDLRQVYFSGTLEDIQVQLYLNKLGLIAKEIIPVAQASIGQVYCVKTDLKAYAVKIKYPNIERRLRNDFRLLYGMVILTRLLPLRHNPITVILQNIKNDVLKECNYLAEAQAQLEFNRAFSKIENINIPEVYLQFSNAEMVVSDWVEGQFLNEYLENANSENRDKVFDLFFRFELMSLLKYGLVHTDPHPGNFLVQENDGRVKLNVLDFGSVTRMESQDRVVLRNLLQGQYEDIGALKADLRQVGFEEDVLDVYKDILGDILVILLEPFYSIGAYSFSQWRLQYKMNTLMASKEWEKPFRLPTQLLRVARMLQGLYYYARKYDINYDWNGGLQKILTMEEGKVYE